MSEGARLELPPGISRVEVELPRGGMRRLGNSESERVAFCGYTVEADGVRLRKPDDPMAGCILLPGDPEVLSRESDRAALRDELVSAAFMALDVVVNLPLVFILLSLVIK
jgi:hypothetical protein